MPVIRNARFPGKVPLIISERRPPAKPKPKGENRKPDPAFLELANEVVSTCRAVGVSLSAFEEAEHCKNLVAQIKNGRRLMPETEQRIRLAVRKLRKRGKL